MARMELMARGILAAVGALLPWKDPGDMLSQCVCSDQLFEKLLLHAACGMRHLAAV